MKKETTSAEIISAKTRKIFTVAFVLLAAALVLTAPVGATINGLSGTGTVADPYQIWDKANLTTLATAVNGGNNLLDEYVKLFADITDYDVPIGTNSSTGTKGTYYFNGTFDGNGHKISGLDFTSNTYQYVGLFGLVGSTGHIKNLSVEGTISADPNYDKIYLGGIVGYNLGTIENCSSSIFINYQGYNKLNVYAGGIAGCNKGTIQNCYYAGRQILVAGASEDANAGGIAGLNSGKIQNCYATGIVSVPTVTNCHAGGIVGWLESPGKIQNCFALNKQINGYQIGKVAGHNTGGTSSSIYAWDGITYQDNGDFPENQNTLNGESKPSSYIWDTLFAPFNDKNVWELYNGENFKLPLLKNLPEPTNADASYLSPSSGGQGGSTSENNNGGGSSAIILSSTSKYRDTVKAEFKEITFDANGGVGYMEGQQLPVGEAGTLNYNEFSYEGYEFVGWALEPTGLVVYADGEEVTIQGDVTLYAVWVQPIPEIPDVPEPVDTPMPVAGMILGLFGAALILRRK